VQYGSGHTISGTISGCTSGVQYGTGYTISGTISGCTSGVYFGNNYLSRGCTFSSNTQDVYNESASGCSLVRGSGAALGSATQINLWKRSSVPVVRYDIGTFLHNLPTTSGGNPVIGWVKCWMPGGRVWTESHADTDTATAGSPPVNTYYHHVYAEDTIAPVYLDIPILGLANVALNFTCHYYDIDGGWTTLPQFQIINPDFPTFGVPAAWVNTTVYKLNDCVLGTDGLPYHCILAHTAETGVKGAPITGTAYATYWATPVLAYQAVANTQGEWQALTLTHTPTEDKQLILRFVGLGNSTSTIIDAYFRCITVTPTFPAVANVIAGSAAYGPTSVLAGTYHEATEAEVQDGVMFGPASAYEGELAGGAGGGQSILAGGVVR
jgi:hypothetical protein